MKIKVEFTKEEKLSLMKALECPEDNDIPEAKEGKFGDFSYDPDGSLEINLSSKLIKEASGLIGKFVNLVMSLSLLIVLIEKFVEEWFVPGEKEETNEIEKEMNKDILKRGLVNAEAEGDPVYTSMLKEAMDENK